MNKTKLFAAIAILAISTLTACSEKSQTPEQFAANYSNEEVQAFNEKYAKLAEERNSATPQRKKEIDKEIEKMKPQAEKLTKQQKAIEGLRYEEDPKYKQKREQFLEKFGNKNLK